MTNPPYIPEPMPALLVAFSRVRDGMWVKGAPTHVFAELLTELEKDGWTLTKLDAEKAAWLEQAKELLTRDGLVDRFGTDGVAAVKVAEVEHAEAVYDRGPGAEADRIAEALEGVFTRTVDAALTAPGPETPDREDEARIMLQALQPYLPGPQLSEETADWLRKIAVRLDETWPGDAAFLRALAEGGKS